MGQGDHDGKRCIILGARGAAGEAIAAFLARGGARLYLLEAEAREGGGSPRIPADATAGRATFTPGSVARAAQAVDGAREALGGIDVLVCAYDLDRLRRSLDRDTTDTARWSWLVGDWLVTYFAVTRAAVPHMIADRGGRVLFITSTAGYTGDLGGGRAGQASILECACASGITGMKTSMARELIPRGVSLNGIAVDPDRPLDRERLLWAADLWLAGRCDYACGQILRLD